MMTSTNEDPFAPLAVTAVGAPRRPFWRRLLDYLAGADARYRELSSLAQVDDHLLDNIGLTRRDLHAILRHRQD